MNFLTSVKILIGFFSSQLFTRNHRGLDCHLPNQTLLESILQMAQTYCHQRNCHHSLPLPPCLCLPSLLVAPSPFSHPSSPPGFGLRSKTKTIKRKPTRTVLAWSSYNPEQLQATTVNITFQPHYPKKEKNWANSNSKSPKPVYHLWLLLFLHLWHLFMSDPPDPVLPISSAAM